MKLDYDDLREAVLNVTVYYPDTNIYKVAWDGIEYADRDTKALVDKVFKGWTL